LDQELYFLGRRIIIFIILRKEYIIGSMDQGLYFLERRIIIFIISRKEYITGRIEQLDQEL
jgi:hypothetical protein